MGMYKSARFWDKVADRYAAMPVRNKDAYEATLDQIRALATVHDTVLELGCGTGTTALALAPHVRRVIATDVSGAMLDKGRAKAKDMSADTVEFVQADVTDAPKGPFDMVLALNLLHLLEDLGDALSEIAERVKPGGVFVSKTFCLPQRRNLIWFFMKLGLPVLQSIGKAPFFAKLSQHQLETAIKTAGFDIVNVEKAPGKDPRLTIIARRAG